MKRGILNFSILLLALRFTFLFSNVNSQDHKLSRKDGLEKRRIEYISNLERLDSLIESKKFIFMRDDEKYRREYKEVGFKLSPYVMMIDSSDAVVNLGSSINHMHIETGSIDKWKLKKNYKRLRLDLDFTIKGPTRFWDIDIYITADANNSAIAWLKYHRTEDSDMRYFIYGRIVKIDSAVLFDLRD
jgi:hypothetical protein